MNITIRKGTPKDSSWIIGLLREGVKGGHYGDSVSAQAPGFLDSIFKHNALMMIKLRDGIQSPCRISASLLVADVDGNSASFLITLQEDNELELHLTSTKKNLGDKVVLMS